MLAEDIGAALGVPATLAALRRTQAGPYTQEQAVGFEQIQQARDEGRLEQLLLSVETVFAHLPVWQVDETGEKRLRNGAPVYRCAAADGLVRLQRDGAFLGVGRVKNGTLHTEKLFVERE